MTVRARAALRRAKPVGTTAKPGVEGHEPAAERAGGRHVLGVVGLGPAHLGATRLEQPQPFGDRQGARSAGDQRKIGLLDAAVTGSPDR